MSSCHSQIAWAASCTSVKRTRSSFCSVSATSVIEARAWQDPNNPGSELPPTDANLGGRACFGFQWTNDPLVRVRYRY